MVEYQESNFAKSEAFQFGARAVCFLRAASVLDHEMGRAGKVLFVPTLHLAGHGLELLLKAVLIHNGHDTKTAVKHGHKINKMWKLEAVEPVRGHLYANAQIVHQEAVDSMRYPDANTVSDPSSMVDRAVRYLGILHAKEKEFPIRYPTTRVYKAPRTPLLVQALYRTADDFVKRPSDFSLPTFRGLSRSGIAPTTGVKCN